MYAGGAGGHEVVIKGGVVPEDAVGHDDLNRLVVDGARGAAERAVRIGFREVIREQAPVDGELSEPGVDGRAHGLRPGPG